MRLLLFFVMLGASSAAGQDLYGVSPRATGLAGATSARPGSLENVYYGPAALPGADDEAGFAELEVGFLWASPQLDVESLDGADLDAAPIFDTQGIWIGARFDIGKPFGLEGVAFGLGLYLPTDLFAWTIRPDDSLQWMLYTDRSAHLSIYAALGARITPWLSLGLGAQVLFDLQTFISGRVTDIETIVDPETGETTFDVSAQLGADVTVFGRAAPIASALVTPIPKLRFALTYRGEIYVEDWGWTRIDGTPGIGAIGYVHRFAHYYQPHQLTLGTSVDLPHDLTLSADVTWNRWSRGITKNADRLGAGRYGDTVVPALGAAWGVGGGVELWLGYRYERSPFTNAGGPTNLLDNDRHIASIGGELFLGEHIDGWPFRLRLAYQTTVLPERTERKDWRRFPSDESLERNPGYPGYRHRGWIPALSVSVEAQW